MPVPAPHDPVWTRLAGGGLSTLKTQHLGAQLLTKRMERSTEPVPSKAKEIHAFFDKWERVLAPEVAQLASL